MYHFLLHNFADSDHFINNKATISYWKNGQFHDFECLKCR